MMITQSINLNLIPGGVLPRINVSQYDKGSRTLQFVLFDGPVLYSIESGTEITIQGSKPDKTAFQYDCTWQGSTVSMDIEQQMTAVAGDVICELVISNNGEILGTCNFILNVESAAVSDDTVISETELPLIEKAVEAATEAAASAASAAQSAEDAAQSAASIQTLTNQVKDMNNVYGAKNFVDIEDFSLSKSNERTKSINKSDIRGEIPDKDVILSFTVSNSTLTVDGACFDVYDTNNTRIGRAQFREDGQYSVRFNGTNFRNLYIFISSADIDSAACTISNIMIRLASITDDTYEPYAKTNQQLTQDTTALLDNMEVNGAVNMLPYPYSDTTNVNNGVTFTDNGDGTIKANGTATGNVGAFVFINDKAGVIPKGTYKCTVEGWSKDSTIDWWYIYNKTTGQDIASPNISNSFTYNGTDVLYFRYTVRIGKTVSNLTIKPMITVASYNGDYVPYAKSNKELTKDISDLETTSRSTVTFSSAIANYNSAEIRKSGNVVTVFLDFTVGDTDISAWDATWCIIPSGFYSTSENIDFVPCGLKNSTSTIIYFIVGKTGGISTGATLAANTRYVCSGVYII